MGEQILSHSWTGSPWGGGRKITTATPGGSVHFLPTDGTLPCFHPTSLTQELSLLGYFLLCQPLSGEPCSTCSLGSRSLFLLRGCTVSSRSAILHEKLHFFSRRELLERKTFMHHIQDQPLEMHQGNEGPGDELISNIQTALFVLYIYTKGTPQCAGMN